MNAKHLFAFLPLAGALALAPLAGCEIVVDEGSLDGDASTTTDGGADGSSADGGTRDGAAATCSAEIGDTAIGASCNACTKAQCCSSLEACAADKKDATQGGRPQCAIFGELLLECAKTYANDPPRLNSCKADAEATFDAAYGTTANNSKFLWQSFVDCAGSTCSSSCN